MSDVLKISVLFAHARSHYKTMPDVDVWDIKRDALRYSGDNPVVAHPPCRAWGRLKAFAKPREGEKELARLAVKWVRRNGGVLEHPAGSSLWNDQAMPFPTLGKDEFGGYTILVNQSDFGHRAQKATWLYIVGVDPEDFPPPDFRLGIPDRLVTQLGRAAREKTPERLATWLVELARSTDRNVEGHVDRGELLEEPQKPSDALAPGQLTLNI